ncbi:aconitase/3-isopropylmalate dehydratase large subunit family protein [Sorangium sp. KYC3313]|uniref:aconitase/3-isopropylmalate dehydratase large subunit family protein n=1 Tax=Sorangium sp. KYC3313 TaxID=3449740 RepID=UPI003F8A7116
MSFTTRILGSLLGRAVAPGELVTVDVARVMAHDGSGPVAARALAKHGIEQLRGADRTVFVFDHYYPPVNQREAALQAEARSFASRYGIPVIAGEGISHQVLPERGLIAPGTVFVGGDSHSCAAGTFGAFATGLGATDIAAVMATGRVWLEVPETLRIRLSGSLPKGTTGHDLVLHVVGRVQIRGALGKAIDFVGPAIEGLSIADRMKLSNHAVEMGAVAGIIGVDARCRAWLEERKANLAHADRVPHDPVGLDADLEIDLAQLEPVIAVPSQPDNIRPASAVEDSVVHQVFIGSCAGGRIEDLRAAAEVLRGHRVAQNVRLLVGPASAEVMMEATRDGTLADLIAAGATVLPPGCGACLGRLGTLGPDEVAVATQNRNFIGRAGSPSSKLYLASPAMAAQIARAGRLNRSEVE